MGRWSEAAESPEAWAASVLEGPEVEFSSSNRKFANESMSVDDFVGTSFVDFALHVASVAERGGEIDLQVARLLAEAYAHEEGNRLAREILEGTLPDDAKCSLAVALARLVRARVSNAPPRAARSPKDEKPSSPS
ncbi:MAG: hypothetical protein R3B99_18470 [Polyangiales bacterium]